MSIVKSNVVGRRVMCRIRGVNKTRTIYGTIVQRCDNDNVYVLKLDHSVQFLNNKVYTYPRGSTILVTKSEVIGT